MPHSSQQELSLTAWMVVVSFALLAVAGLVWHGVTAETLQRIWQNIVDRPSRHMAFRFVLQPSMAAFFAVRHGIEDARGNRAGYLRTIVWSRGERNARLREGLNATARIILIAVVIDIVYQTLELQTLHPAEVPVVALLLAFLPYVLLRGLVTRVAQALSVSEHQR